jgi:hypothetical protein
MRAEEEIMPIGPKTCCIPTALLMAATVNLRSLAYLKMWCEQGVPHHKIGSYVTEKVRSRLPRYNS